MASILDAVLFTPTLGGTTDWVVSSAVTGYLTPTASGAVNGKTYYYRAEDAAKSQWEEGYGVWNSGTSTLTRVAVLFNSLGTTAKINFTTVPQVGIVLTSSMILQFDDAMSLTTTQKKQAHSNLFVAPVTTILTSGTAATWTPTAGCLLADIEVLGGGAGGAGGGGAGAGNGTAGSSTTFGSLTASGGAIITSQIVPGAPGTGTGGDENISGGYGQYGGPSTVIPGGQGGSTIIPGGGIGGAAAANGVGSNAAANSGSGGGGGSTNNAAYNVGAGGSAGGVCRKLLASPTALTYTIGAGGTGGAAGANGTAGGNGAAGRIRIIEYFGS